MNEFRHAPRPCPFCGKTLNGSASATSDTAPETGDIMICLDCYMPTIVDGDSNRKPTPEEAKDMANNTDLILHMVAIRMAKAQYNARNN